MESTGQKKNKGRVFKKLNLRRKLSEAQNHRCAYCHKRLDFLTIDHVIPHSITHKGHKSRATNFANTVVACERCNNLKGNHCAYLFYALINGEFTFKEAKMLYPKNMVPNGFGVLDKIYEQEIRKKL
jgi:predicted restriction endonuclease